MIARSLLTAFLATALLARADVLPPAQDTSSSKGKLTAAGGKATTLAVCATKKGFVLFNLNSLPAGVQAADIVNTRLRVYFPTVAKPGDIAIHAVTGAWDETSTAAEPAVDGTVIAQFPAVMVTGKKFIEVDVTPTVQAWRTTPATNHGFAFVASGLANVLIGAKEGPGSGYPCELDVEIERGIAVGSITSAMLAHGAVGSSQLAGNLNLGGTTSFAGNVGIGTTTPGEALQVGGAVIIGTNTNTTPVPGVIRWTGFDFEGYNGFQWVC